MFVVGALDDLRDVSPPAKVAGQVLSRQHPRRCSASRCSTSGSRSPSYDYVVLSPDLAPLVTVLTVVVLANAINLIDGLDGLAAGIVIIAGAALFLYSDRLFKAGLLEGSNIAPLVAVIAVGVCVGFLPHNFNPAQIFMGDAGAMFLGLLLAATTITVGGRTADQFSGQTYFFFAPLLIPIVILGVPILDTVFSFLRRVVHAPVVRASPTSEHLHHRLMRLGPRSPPRGRDPLALDRAASAVALLPTLHQPRELRSCPLGVVGARAWCSSSCFHPGRPQRPGDEARGHGDADAEDGRGEVVELDERRRAPAGLEERRPARSAGGRRRRLACELIHKRGHGGPDCQRADRPVGEESRGGESPAVGRSGEASPSAARSTTHSAWRWPWWPSPWLFGLLGWWLDSAARHRPVL